MSQHTGTREIAKEIAQQFGQLPQVKAVTLGGSTTTRTADRHSDIDLYIYVTEQIPLTTRRELITKVNTHNYEIGNTFWEPGDEWVDDTTNAAVDIMYRDIDWASDQLDRVLVRYEASIGNSTCIWYNIRHAIALYDPVSWFAHLQSRAVAVYPKALRDAIINKNYPILRRNQSSYTHQIALAVKRHDLVSMNHRVAALLASYFDIIFAINRQPHPGEKRMLTYATKHCKLLPKNMKDDVEHVIWGLAATDTSTLLEAITMLLDRLDILLISEELVSTKQG
jgi:predicted nucleotidyltransferase